MSGGAERFGYSHDSITTTAYNLALDHVEKVATSNPNGELSLVDFDLAIPYLVPPLRTIILSAGIFEIKSGHYYFYKSDGRTVVFMDPEKERPWRRDGFPMIRLFVNPDNNKRRKEARSIDLWIPDSEDTQYIWRAVAVEKRGRKTYFFYPSKFIKNPTGQEQLNSFLALWREGLGYLLAMTHEPTYLPEPMENPA